MTLIQNLTEQNENLAIENSKLKKQLQSWEDELSKVMPADFKDWWENSKSEWPIIAKLVIENLREREKIAWDMLSDK
jgi:regulator of replication initiation timing